MKIAYTFAQCIYSKYYVYAFRKSLLWHVNHYHYFDHLQPKRRKVTEKKTRLANSMNKKTMFARVLSHHEPNEETEIDSG